VHNIANALGEALTALQQRRWLQALAVSRSALAQDPDLDAIALRQVEADALYALESWQEADRAYRQLLELDPKNVAANTRVGELSLYLRRPIDAINLLLTALKHDANYAPTWYCLGLALQSIADFSGAQLCQQRALELDPNCLVALSCLVRVKEQNCDWEQLDSFYAELRTRVSQPNETAANPFFFFTCARSNQEMLLCSQLWGTLHYLPLMSATERPVFVHAPKPKTKCRIAYLSAHLADHATAELMVEVFELHHREQFEVLAYSAHPGDDSSIEQRLKAAFDVFNPVASLSPLALAQKIYADKIDILIDLDGYTRNTRVGVLAYRPAPVQVSYLGFAATLGLGLADYLLTDRYVTPPDQAQWFCEAFAYLPDSYQCNDRQREIGATLPRSAYGLPEEALVLCCFNQSYKITPVVFDVWCQILQLLPESVLWLLSMSPQAEINLRQQAELHGVSPSRLVFAPPLALPEHLGRLRQADLMLDTWPMNAHTTASDALWAGVPMVSMSGATFAARVGGSLLCATGLSACIVETIPAYVDLVCALGRNPTRRQALRQQLAQGSALPLFDTPRFVAALEALYQKMWQRRLEGLPNAPLNLL